MNSLAVIIPAGGVSTRFGSNKLLAQLEGTPVLERTLAAFAVIVGVKQIVVASADPEIIEASRRVLPSVTIAPGGAHRAQSVLNALKAVDTSIEWVAVHDAARPLVSIELIERTLTAAKSHGCAAPALPVSLTIKQADGPLPAKVQKTVPRHQLWAMQTPQIMRRDILLDAFGRCPIDLKDVTDDVQLLELIGAEVWLVPGEERNLKITTRLDLAVATAILQAQ